MALIHHISGCSYLGMRCQGDPLPLSGHQQQLLLVLVGRMPMLEGLPSALLQLKSQQQLPVDHHVCIAPAAPASSWELTKLSQLQD